MIGYVTLGSNDLGKAAEFYDEVLGTVGGGRTMESDTFIAWSVSPSTPAISVTRPYDGKRATVGNGTMVALILDSPEKVDALHAKAIEAGGRDEGPPGPRGDSGFYAAYFRDLDGNKLAAFTMVSPG